MSSLGAARVTTPMLVPWAETVEMVLASGMEVGLNDSYDALETIARALAGRFEVSRAGPPERSADRRRGLEWLVEARRT